MQFNSAAKLLTVLCLFWSISHDAHAISHSDIQTLRDDFGQEFEDSQFIVPNEFEYWRAQPLFKGQKGTLIGIGTFRVLADASYGSFGQVIFMDIDQKTVELNTKQIESLKKASTVEGFLADLIGEPELKEKIRAKIQGELGYFDTVFYASSPEELYVERLLYFAENIDLNGRTFLTNPAAYKRLRRLALEGKMHSVAANLAGEGTFPKLSHLLKDAGEYVSTLDVSNVPEYLIRPAKVWKTFLNNLREIPWSSKPLLISTTLQADQTNEYADEFTRWEWIGVPPATFIQQSKNGFGGKDKAFVKFIRDLHQHQSDYRNSAVKCEAMLLN